MTVRFAGTLVIALLAPMAMPAAMAASVVAASVASDTIARIENRWVDIRYVMTDTKERLAAARELKDESTALRAAHPGDLEIKFWHAMVLLLEAEYKRDLGSLKVVREAKRLFEELEAENPRLLGGRVHTGLGMLYSGVPGWPIAFGNDGKAEDYFLKALAIDPAGQEANYLYADFLRGKKKRAEAIPYFEAALRAPIRAEHARAEQFRRKEVEEDLAATRAELKP